MPVPETSDRHQAAMLWPFVRRDRRGEIIVSDTGEQIYVRWENRKARKVDPKGNTIALDAVVVVAQEVAIDSMMWLGEEDDLPGTTGVPESDIYVVKTYDTASDVKNRATRRELGLVRYTNRFPDQE